MVIVIDDCLMSESIRQGSLSLISMKEGNIKGGSKADLGNAIFRRFKSVILYTFYLFPLT